ncbi:hypothetical protein NPIL_378041 [Nephila pilipes]|uniref:Uncharacterized protein n=1 Tax=Nephila pilipes TaxID=299642 RepID=A0A8X6QG38_NEPPI|nr:hypothetical protein NPIL_378041 [Nephila pilipes]
MRSPIKRAAIAEFTCFMRQKFSFFGEKMPSNSTNILRDRREKVSEVGRSYNSRTKLVSVKRHINCPPLRVRDLITTGIFIVVGGSRCFEIALRRNLLLRRDFFLRKWQNNVSDKWNGCCFS